MNDKPTLSRRQFIGAAGGIAGMAALASLPFDAQATENDPKIDVSDFSTEQRETDVLVIGGGMAGLFAAVKAHDAGAKVLMVSKGRLGSSGMTPFAKGIFSYDKETANISIDEFVAKVSESAIGTNNPVFTRQVAEHSAARVAELRSWGFFDSPLYYKSFMRPIEERNIDLEERIMITHLHKKEGRVVGASGFSLDENKVIHYQAKTVILCTGAGGFKPNGFPMSDLTHDGTIMAYKIGAMVTGKEWNDGHPGSAENSGSSYDNWNGQVEQSPSITGVTINHHLGMDTNYQGYMYGGPVTMGPPSAGADKKEGMPSTQEMLQSGPYVPEAFRMTGGPGKGKQGGPGGEGGPGGKEGPGGKGGPGGKEGGPGGRGPGGKDQGFLRSLFASKGQSGPPGMSGTQVGGSSAGLAIHKSEGLVPIDDKGLSTVPGLYSAGDALGSYMSGSIYTQIGSSLAGSAVQGAFSGEAAAKDSQALTQSLGLDAQQLAQINSEILAPLKRSRGFSPAWVTQVLQGVMIPNFVLYIKRERMMQAALAYVEELYDHHVPMLLAKDRHELRLAHETENMIISAEMKLKASIMRTESRCSHYRLDYPDIDYKNWNAWLHIYQDAHGVMQFEKQAFDKWPAFS